MTLWSIRLLPWTPVQCPCKNLSLSQKTSGKKDKTQQKTLIQALSPGAAHSIKNIPACTAGVAAKAEGMVGLPLSNAAKISARSERLHSDGHQVPGATQKQLRVHVFFLCILGSQLYAESFFCFFFLCVIHTDR